MDRMHIAYLDATDNTVVEVQDDKLDNDFNYQNPIKGMEHTNNGDICKLEVQPSTHQIETGSEPYGRPLGIRNLGQEVSSDHLSKLSQLKITFYTYSKPSPTDTKGGCNTHQSYQTSADQKSLVNFNILFQWSGSTITMVTNGGQTFQLPTDPVFHNLTVDEKAFRGTYKDFVNGGPYNEWLAGSTGKCQDFILVPTTATNKDAAFTGYWENDVSDNDILGHKSLFVPPAKNCYLDESNTNGLDNSGFVTITGSASSGGVPTPPPVVTPPAPTCNISGGFGWVLCPAIDMGNSIFGALKLAVVDLLQSQVTLTKDRYPGAYAVWQSFRGLANVFFVLIFLFIIFSTTLSIGLSNYDIKKMLPRLVVAVILVQFSWVLAQLGFDISNILGAGIGSIVHAAAPSIHTGPSEVVTDVGVALTVGAVGVALLAFALPLIMALFGAILSVLAVFLTLEFRILLLLLLVVLSPFAFIAWVLPNTESMFKTWFKTFSRLLLMYPMIVLLFAFAAIAQAIPNPSTSDPWQQILAALMPIAVFFAVPWTFKWAGGAMNAAGGFFTGRAAGINKGFRSSGLAKGLQQSRQERGFLKAQDSKNVFGRIQGRAMSGAGNLIPGSVTNRKLASGYQSTMASLGKESRSKLQNDLLDPSIQGNAAFQDADGNFDGNAYLKSVAGNKKGSQFERQGALEMLGERNAVPELETLRDSMASSSNSSERRIWNNALQTNISAIATKAPQLISGNSAFEKMSAEQVAGLHQKSFGTYMDYMEGPRPTGAAEGASWEKARANASTSFVSLQTSAGQWSKLNAAQQTRVLGFLPTAGPAGSAKDSRDPM